MVLKDLVAKDGESRIILTLYDWDPINVIFNKMQAKKNLHFIH